MSNEPTASASQVDTTTYHRYDAQIIFDVEDETAVHIENNPPVSPLPLEDLIEQWLTAMFSRDADRLWAQNIGRWETFCDTAERALEDVLPLTQLPLHDCYCPDAVFENTIAFYEQSQTGTEDVPWIKAAAVWLSQWLNLFNSCYRSEIVDDLDDLGNALDAARQNEHLPDNAINRYLDAHHPENDDTEQPSDTSDPLFEVSRR